VEERDARVVHETKPGARGAPPRRRGGAQAHEEGAEPAADAPQRRARGATPTIRDRPITHCVGRAH